jgi:hypothetical protein
MIRRTFVLLALLHPASLLGSEPSPALPDTGRAYVIEARLDPKTRALTGSERIRWVNDTGETIDALPLHLYLNGFSNTATSWMREEDISRFELTPENLLKMDDDPWGWIDPRSIVQRAEETGEALPATFRFVQPDDGNPRDRSLALIDLPRPVPPGGATDLTIDFEAKLPIPMARTGGRLDFFLLGQWYPKIGVLEPAGVRGAAAARMAAAQFHSLTEFYADFADYDVTLTLPDGWIVGGTGRAEEPLPAAAGGAEDTAPGPGWTRHRFRQRAVHDAAYVIGRSLAEVRRTVTPERGNPVDVRWLVPAGTEALVAARLHPAVEGAMNEMARRLIPYPYDTLTVATVPVWAGETAGMEYPTFFTGGSGEGSIAWWPRATVLGPELTVIHEYAHQYFYGLVASDEPQEAVLDEGFTQYWENEIAKCLYGERASQGSLFGRAMSTDDLSGAIVEATRGEIDDPLRRAPTWLIARGRLLGAMAYHRPALALETAARRFGRGTFDQVMQAYVRRFAYRHPRWEDFLHVAQDAGGEEMAAFLAEAFEQPRVPDYRVDKLASTRWSPPLGHVVAGGEALDVTPDNEDSLEDRLIDSDALEQDGLVTMEITDPGWARQGAGEPGKVWREQRPLEALAAAAPTGPSEPPPASTDGKTVVYESLARLEGPAWDHLPVEIEFRFEDGVVVKDTWPGRSVWRAYRFTRPSRLQSVRMDPEGRLAVDARPQNNARSMSADRPFTVRWTAWLTGLAQWMASGAALWL